MDNIPNILDKGLLSRFSNFWVAAGGCIYLSNKPDTGFGEMLLHIAGVPMADKLNQISEWEFVYWGDIPPDFISLQKGKRYGRTIKTTNM